MGLLLGTATVPDALTFALAAVIVVAGALGVVCLSNPVHCALSLVMTLFGIAVLFVEEDAQFLAAVQIIVYSGAIVVLFLFVIMLLGIDRREKIMSDTFKGQRLVAGLLGAMVLAEVILLGSDHWATGAHSVSAPISKSSSNVVQIGQSLFTTYLLPFEVTSALLVVAVIGAVVLARRTDVRGLVAYRDESEGPTDSGPPESDDRPGSGAPATTSDESVVSQ